MRGYRTLLYHKLALSNTWSHAKNRNDPCPATWSNVASPGVGFSAVAILGGGWLQSLASDGPPWELCISHHLNNCIAFPSHQTTSIFHRIVPSAKKIKPFYEYDIFCNIFQIQKKCHTMLTTQSCLFSYHRYDKFSFDIENRNVKMKTWWFLVRMFMNLKCIFGQVGPITRSLNPWWANARKT